MAKRNRNQLTQGKTKSGKGGGLYDGKAGSYAAQQNPAAYLNTVGLNAGLKLGTGSSFDDWYQNQGFNNLYNVGYQQALGGNERLTFQDYLKKAPGGDLKSQMETGYKRFQANSEPQTHYVASQYASGGLKGTGTEHERIIQDDLYGKYRGQYEAARLSNPMWGWDDWLAGRATTTDPSLFAPGATPIQGGGGGGGMTRGKKKGGR